MRFYLPYGAPTYSSYSCPVAELYGTGLAFLTEKFSHFVSLRAPPGLYLTPNAFRIWRAASLAVQLPR